MESGISTLFDIYEQLYGPKITMAYLDELAADLSQIAGRSRPWTGKFLHSLLRGYPGFKANGQLGKALAVLAGRLAGLDEIQSRAEEVQVLAVNHLPAGTLVLGTAQRCAAPGCQITFVPNHPRQKYHSKSCAGLARRQRSAG
jgi:hypothetical protein